MKTLILTAAFAAASAVSAAPAASQPDAKVAARAAAQKPKPKATVAQVALQGLERLLRDYTQPGPKPAPAPTPQQRAAMKSVFGSERPVQVQTLPKAGTSTVQRLTLPAHQYRADGTTVRWSPATLLVTRSADGGRLDSTGELAQLTMRGAAGNVELKEGSMENALQRSADGLWFGTMHGKVDSIVFDTPKGPGMHLSQVGFTGTTIERGDRVDQRVDMTAERLTVAGEDLEALHMAYQLNGLDRALLRRMSEQTDGDVAQGLKFLKEMALSGAELQIDDLSARYKGHTASIQGNIALAGATAEDLETPQRLSSKVSMHLDITVPLGLVREATAAMAARNKNPSAPTAQQMYEGVIGKAVSNGYARVEGETLRSTIEWREGRLVVNGKPVDLPTQPKRAPAGTP